MRTTILGFVVLACSASEASIRDESPEAVEVTRAPAPRLSASPPRTTCSLGRMPYVDTPSVDVDVVANVVVRSAAEARATIDHHGPPGSDPDALIAIAHAETDLYRLEGDAQVLQEAIRHWAQVIQMAPSHAHMDEILYQLAWSLGAIDQHDRARQVYHRLIRHYPQSPLVLVGYVHFGDHYVRAGDGIAARRFYERALEMVRQAPEGDPMRAYLAYAYAWASKVAGESVDPVELERARNDATDALREAIETDWCAR